jgi:hypothetical protein
MQREKPRFEVIPNCAEHSRNFWNRSKDFALRQIKQCLAWSPQPPPRRLPDAIGR